MRSKTPRILGCAVLLLCALALTGCQWKGGVPVVSKLPDIEPIEVSYRLENLARDLGQISEWSDFGVQASYSPADTPAELPADRPHAATLQIEYPHPERGADAALATMVVYDGEVDFDSVPTEDGGSKGSRRWWSRLWPGRSKEDTAAVAGAPMPTEILTLEIPRSQFELLISDLNRDQYSSDAGGTDKHASLEIRRNHKHVLQSSLSEPRLNEFMRRIYRDGDVILGQRRPSPSLIQASAISAPRPSI